MSTTTTDVALEIGCLFSAAVATPEHCAAAEALGYRFAWVTDSPAIMADPWMTLARAADRTTSIRLGVCALTPRMRHVVATAGAAATLDALAPGRVDIVVGTGFTSQALINQRPARWREVEQYVEALRGLLAGDSIVWDGQTVALPYVASTGIALPADVALWVAAHGPKGYATGRRLGAGIVTNPGHGPSNHFAPEDRVFVQVNGTVLDDGETFDGGRVLAAAGPSAALHLHLGADGGQVESAEVRDFAAAIAALPDERRHIEIHRGHLTEVTELERPFVTGRLIREATETGSAAEMRAALEGFAGDGAAGALYFPAGPDIGRELAAFAAAAGLTAR